MDTSDPGQQDPPRFRMRAPGDPPKPGEEYESPTLPLPPPRDKAELDVFLHAVASTPSGERQLIIDTIAGFADREQVATLLHEDVLDTPVRDVSRHLMILSLIGELRHDSSIPVVEQIVWLPDEDAAPGDLRMGPDVGDSGSACHFRADGALQARAAEMLVWLTRGADTTAVHRILKEHPASIVRVATIDALAYAADDDPQALTRIRELVREDDRWAVGLPRRTAEIEPAEFERRVLARMEEIGVAAQPELPEPNAKGGRDVS